MSQGNDDLDHYNQPTQPYQPQYGQPQQIGRPPTQPFQQPPSAHGQAFPPTPGQGGQPGKHKISRRTMIGGSVLGLAGLGVGSVALGAWMRDGGLSDVFHGPIANNQQIGHLLRKAGFGASPADIAAFSKLSYSEAVDRLINYQQVPDELTNSRLNALNLDLNKPINQQQWWLLRMAWTQRPLLEKMTLFWHGVLVSSYTKVGGPKAYMRMMIQNQFLRDHAFDTFDNIMLGITADPAMLFYLDLTKSHKTAPNENYAREMMELFTIGLGHYTQQDVMEGASALTGWHVKGMSSVYVPADHSDLTKTYLGHTGNLDYKDVINILVNHPAAPWFISRKLFTFFVYENPSNDDLQPLVETYVKSGHNMGEVMRTLLNSPQFLSAKAYRSRIKSPTEFTAGAYRALNMQSDGTGLPTFTTLMGQTLLNPPNVGGWPGDKVSSYWLNSGAWMTRLNYIDALLVRGTFTRKSTPTPLDFQSVVNTNNIDTPEHFVDYYSSFLLDGNVDPTRRQMYINYFSTPDTSRGGQQVTLKNGQRYPLNRVRGTLYLMMASPEYQLN
jgi:uncharacterized protein (DUF1800 family)